MKTKRKAGRAGMLVQPDDFAIGDFYAIYGLKHETEEPLQIAGMAFKLLALNLPFMVGKLAHDPAHPPLTFDTRFLNVMRVSDDYVKAQAEGTT